MIDAGPFFLFIVIGTMKARTGCFLTQFRCLYRRSLLSGAPPSCICESVLARFAQVSVSRSTRPDSRRRHSKNTWRPWSSERDFLYRRPRDCVSSRYRSRCARINPTALYAPRQCRKSRAAERKRPLVVRIVRGFGTRLRLRSHSASERILPRFLCPFVYPFFNFVEIARDRLYDDDYIIRHHIKIRTLHVFLLRLHGVAYGRVENNFKNYLEQISSRIEDASASLEKHIARRQHTVAKLLHPMAKIRNACCFSSSASSHFNDDLCALFSRADSLPRPSTDVLFARCIPRFLAISRATDVDTIVVLDNK